MPDVSVITPCFNSQQFVAATLRSVQKQADVALEHIVVDDGSTDDSLAAIHSAIGDGYVHVLTGPNGGVAAARNRGFAAAPPDTRYLLFLDADDLLEPEMLGILVDHLDRNPDVGMAYCACRLIDSAGSVLTQHDPRERGWFDRLTAGPMGGVRRICDSDPRTPFDAVYTAGVLLPSCTLLRRSVYVQTPGFDESFGHLFEDADLFRRMALRAAVHYVDRPLVRYRRHDSQSTADGGRLAQKRAELDRKWHDLPGLTAEERAKVHAAEWFSRYRVAAYQGVRAGGRHLVRGHIAAATRFAAGAAVRYSISFFKRPRAA